jgi:hypothetical protein
MRGKQLFVSLLLLVALFLLPTSAMACACCAEAGVWHEYNGELEEYQTGILQEIRLSPRADLYMTEAGEDVYAKGIEMVADFYNISLLPTAKQWDLTFRNGKGQTGKLTLLIPNTYISYKVDMREKKPSTMGAILYKEWRLAGDVKGTGIFQRGLAEGGTFKLVLQGRGNGCDNAEDFNHWVLQISGPQADYAFYGDMRKQGARPATKRSRS